MATFTRHICVTIGAGLAAFLGAIALIAATSSTPASAAQPAVEQDVTVSAIEVTCRSGAGRLDIELTNAADEPQQITLGIDGVRRAVEVPARGTADVVITGRSDGTRDLTIDDAPASTVTVFCGFPDGPDFDVQLTPDCSGEVGIIEVQLTNPSDKDSLAVITPRLRNTSGYRREVVVPANSNSTIRISGRRDGINNIAVNGSAVGGSVWIDCVPNTGPNDLIADATSVTVSSPFIVVDPAFDPTDTYGHTQAELDDTTGCIVISRGTAWYEFTATSDALIVAGSDDSEIAFYRPLTAQPSQLSDLELVGCGEDFDIRLTPGETYLMAFSFDVEPGLTRLYPGSRTSNDTVVTARDLTSDFDSASDLFARFEDGEGTDCFARPERIAELGTIWWKWTATGDLADLEILSYRPGALADRLTPDFLATEPAEEYGLYTSAVTSPTVADLQLAGCQGASIQPGQTYWIQVPAFGKSTTAINVSSAAVLDPEVVVSCLGNAGRFDITVRNQSQTVVPVEVGTSIGFNVVARSFDLAPGAERSVAVTGRAEGLHSVAVIAGARYTRFGSQLVDCRPDPEVVGVTASCVGGSGRIDVDIPAATEAPSPLYSIRFIGPTSVIERNLLASSFATVETVTGRVDGAYRVEVDIDREPALVETITIDCS